MVEVFLKLPTKILYSGDIDKGYKYLPMAKSLLDRLIKDMSFQGLWCGKKERKLFDGTLIKVSSNYSITTIKIYSPKISKKYNKKGDDLYFDIQAIATRMEFDSEFNTINSNPVALGMEPKCKGLIKSSTCRHPGEFSFLGVNPYIDAVAIRNLTQVRYSSNKEKKLYVSLFMYDFSAGDSLNAAIRINGDGENTPDFYSSVSRDMLLDYIGMLSKDLKTLYIVTCREVDGIPLPSGGAVVTYRRYSLREALEGSKEKYEWYLSKDGGVDYANLDPALYWADISMDRSGRIGYWHDLPVSEQVHELYKEDYAYPPPTPNYGPWIAWSLDGVKKIQKNYLFSIDKESFVEGGKTKSYTVAPDDSGTNWDYRIIKNVGHSNWTTRQRIDHYCSQPQCNPDSFSTQSGHREGIKDYLEGFATNYICGRLSFDVFDGVVQDCKAIDDYTNSCDASFPFHSLWYTKSETKDGFEYLHLSKRSHVSKIADYVSMTTTYIFEQTGDSNGSFGWGSDMLFNTMQTCYYGDPHSPYVDYNEEIIEYQFKIEHPVKRKEVRQVVNSFISYDEELDFAFYGVQIIYNSDELLDLQKWEIFCSTAGTEYDITEQVSNAFEGKLLSGFDEDTQLFDMLGFNAIIFAKAVKRNF